MSRREYVEQTRVVQGLRETIANLQERQRNDRTTLRNLESQLLDEEAKLVLCERALLAQIEREEPNVR
jgi:hypothetical protein